LTEWAIKVTMNQAASKLVWAMMSTILNILAVVMLVAHASLGCCLHHAHSVQFGQSEKTSPGCQCCSYGDALASEPNSSESDGPSGPCTEDTCQPTVVSVPSRVELDQSSSVDFGLAYDQLALNFLSALVECGLPGLDCWQLPAPSVRLHLLHQILLI
jgi:hypothetical protein